MPTAVAANQAFADYAPPSREVQPLDGGRPRLRRALFRFGFVLVLIETFPGAFWRLPFAERLSPGWHRFIDRRVFGPVVRAAMRVLGVKSTGFIHGDSTYALVALLCLAGISAIVAVLWTVLDWPRPNDRRLHEWLRVYVRFYAGAVLLDYG